MFRGPGNFFDSFRVKYPEVLYLFQYVNPGSFVIGPEDGQPTWICEIAIFTHQGPRAALDRVLAISREIVEAFLPFIFTV